LFGFFLSFFLSLFCFLFSPFFFFFFLSSLVSSNFENYATPAGFLFFLTWSNGELSSCVVRLHIAALKHTRILNTTGAVSTGRQGWCLYVAVSEQL
jgi:hypothetical protein